MDDDDDDDVLGWGEKLDRAKPPVTNGGVVWVHEEEGWKSLFC